MSCIREALSSRGKVILDIAAMLLFAVIPFWRMGLSGLWEINGRGFPWVPQIQFGHSLSTWLSPFGGGPGFFNIIEVQRVWENAIWFAANLIGVATPIIQRCYLIGATFVAMVGK